MKRSKLPRLGDIFLFYGSFSVLFSMVLLLFFLYLLADSQIDSSYRLEFSFVLLLVVGNLLSSSVSFLAGRKVLEPATEISHAMAEVAKGNFNIRMNSNGCTEESNEMSNNFNVMVRELETIETLRNDFVVTISHEFKTPLAAIEGYATILSSFNLPQIGLEYCQKIIENARRISRFSTNALMLSNLENQASLREKKKYRLDEQLRQAVMTLEPLWQKKETAIDLELEQAVYHGNEDLLMQVWLNLISNAVKFTPKDGHIFVSLRQEPGTMLVTVSDNGIGIPKEKQKHIFDKFYKSDRPGGGNGLGLAIVKRIVDLSDGKIIVKSKPGVGSSFTVMLPGD